MTKPLLAFLLLPFLATTASAQITPGASRSDSITLKIKRLDVLIQVVPLALTKEEFPPLLSAIEKIRQKDKELAAAEDKDLAGVDAAVSKAMEEAIGKEKYPPREVQNQVAALYRALGIRRQLFVIESVDAVFAVCKATLNEGQLKTMEKSLKPEMLEPSLKSDSMDADTKIKFFIRKVLLDPVAYDLLVEMSRKKKEAEG